MLASNMNDLLLGLELKMAPEDRGDPNDPRVRLKRDCVGIMAAFKLKDLPDHVVIVANTHLYWDPEWADVKLAQAKYLLSRLALFRTLVSNRLEFYQYLISGNSQLAPAVECLEDMPIPLCSVYAFTRGEPPFTNCTPDFTNTLDYILFAPTDNIKPQFPGASRTRLI
nr:isoform 3 of carbon catabolite repressor protein 4 like 4 [Quercus suber]